MCWDIDGRMVEYGFSSTVTKMVNFRTEVNFVYDVFVLKIEL